MNILIIDDEPRIRTALSGLLEDEGHRVVSCETGEDGLAVLRQKTMDLIFLDVMLPGMDGLAVLKSLLDSSVRIFMISGKSDLSTAVEATRLGAHDFFEKPLNPDRILLAVKNLEKQLALEMRLTSLESDLETHEMIGESPLMIRLREAVARAAPSNGRVLITGENGTGKELVARAVHRGSHRRNQSFITLNCAALPQSLVESELFGYEKGAFTGALKQKPGRFESADKGTLFLDEVGDMALETQAKLLRVLEAGEAVRLGGTAPYGFDVRIIAATNKDPAEEIKKGRFREDLFYRLNVIPLQVPPLRERLEDVPLLAGYYLDYFGRRTGRGLKEFGEGALQALQKYEWPGNVRELKNFIERLIIMGEGRVIEAGQVRSMLPESGTFADRIKREPDSRSFREQVADFEREILADAYQRVRGNVSAMARALKMDRANLYRKLKQYGIQSEAK
ncbi:MAG TPA: sigma-54-dependent Fis family transcriptional regulator [bacterium]|nr:sigma-54-dependent Fis family transcriptional regulator [bacterium]